MDKALQALQSIASLPPETFNNLMQVANQMQQGGGYACQTAPYQAWGGGKGARGYTPVASNGAWAGAVAASGQFCGVIKSYNELKGFGFVACNDTFATYGQDVFLHKNEAQGHSLGSQVYFNVKLNEKGQPQAIGVTAAAPAAVGGARFQPKKRTRQFSDDEPGQQAKKNKVEREPTEGIFIGTVKSYNPMKGFGFISCPDTFNKYGRDVFLHKSEEQGIPVGSTVSFGVHLNEQNNPQANNVVQV